MAKNQETQFKVRATSHTTARLLVRLGRSSSLPTKELAAPFSVSYSTIRRRLLELYESEVVERERNGRAHEWRLAYPDSTSLAERSAGLEFETLVTEVIDELAAQLAAERGASLPNAVQMWVDNRGLPDETNQERYAYRLAVYRRFLRSLLYRLHAPEFEDKLSKLSVGVEWEDLFTEAGDLTDNSGFKSGPVDELVSQAPDWIDRVLLSLHPLAIQITTPAAALAEIYESLTSQPARRELGQFATPEFIGQFLASWAVRSADDSVLDPGIGAGKLAEQALKRKLNLGSSSPLGDITGIDVDQTAISMAAVTLKLVDGEGSSHLVAHDFLEYSPRSFTESGHEVAQFDGVITNPPYSRHQTVDDSQKKRFNEVIRGELDYELSPRTPLYGYFLAHATTFLKPGGRLAAIVPSKFLDTEFGRDLKRFLLDEFHIHALIQLSDEIDVFEGVRTQPTILLLEREQEAAEKVTRIIRLNEWPDGTNPKALLNEDITDNPAISEITVLAQRLLSPTERWSHYLEEDDLLDLDEMARFGDIADISRGIATGDNDYFCLTQSEVEEYGIPDEYLQPIIRTARGLRTIDIQQSDWEKWRDDNQPVQLLYCYEADENGDEKKVSRSDINNEGVLEYLDNGKTSDTTDGYLVSKRETWYCVEKQTPAPILAKYMNRTGFLFMRNYADVRTLNNVHTIEPNADLSEKSLEALLAYLNSWIVNKHLSKYSHNYQGLQKVEISQLNDVPILNPLELDQATRTTLSELYERLRVARREEEDDETILNEIHRVLEPHLHWEDERQS